MVDLEISLPPTGIIPPSFTIMSMAGGYAALAISTLAFTGEGTFEDFLDAIAGAGMIIMSKLCYPEIDKMASDYGLSTYVFTMKVIIFVGFVIGTFILIEALIPDYIGKIKRLIGNVIRSTTNFPYAIKDFFTRPKKKSE